MSERVSEEGDIICEFNGEGNTTNGTMREELIDINRQNSSCTLDVAC